MNSGRSDDSSAPTRRLAKFWRSVAGLVPGTCVTEAEAIAFVSGALPQDRREIVERLLAETPGFDQELRRIREEWAAHPSRESRPELAKRVRRAASSRLG